MSKSPISLLQEFCVRDGYVPNYIFMTSINNGSSNQFVCKVTCKNLSTNGFGNNKKEAKHNAAQSMLSLLLQNNNTSMSPLQQKYRTVDNVQNFTSDIYETYSNISDNLNTYPLLKTQVYPALNYVGLLQERCTQYKLNIVPSYKVIGESGPDHMKIFTVEGSIGTLRETGKAHCKKSAKQEAAKNLLHHLQNISSKEKDESFKQICKDNEQKLGLEIFDVDIVPTMHAADVSKKPDCIEFSTDSVHIENLPINNRMDVISIESLKKNESPMCMLEDDLQKLNIKILDAKTDKPNIAVTELSDEPLKGNENCKRSLENDVWKSNIEISNLEISEPILSVATPSKKAQSILNIRSIADDKDMQNVSVMDKHASIVSVKPAKENENYKCILEKDLLRKLNVEISDMKINEALSITKLSKQAESIYLASSSKNTEVQNVTVKDYHILFKKKYSTKISDNLKERMKNICELNNCRSYKIEQIRQDIQTILGVKIKQIKFSNCETGLIIVCLRLLSTPIITQFGIGKSVSEAEDRAMYEIINTIMDFLK